MQFVFSRQAPPDNLTKESAPDELVKAIRQISQGKKYISPSLAEKLALVHRFIISVTYTTSHAIQIRFLLSFRLDRNLSSRRIPDALCLRD